MSSWQFALTAPAEQAWCFHVILHLKNNIPLSLSLSSSTLFRTAFLLSPYTLLSPSSRFIFCNLSQLLTVPLVPRCQSELWRGHWPHTRACHAVAPMKLPLSLTRLPLIPLSISLPRCAGLPVIFNAASGMKALQASVCTASACANT